ncbi:glycosyltransferase family 39 protein [Spirosoma litoris]
MSSATVFVMLTQFLVGFGPITRLRAVKSGYSLLGLAMLTGLGFSSILPFLLQFLHLPIATTPLFIGLGLLTALSLVLLRGQWLYLREAFSSEQLKVQPYELPFLGFWGYLLFISAWKCAWFPNLPFDTIVGPDLVATYAVREHTLVSSVFTQHLSSVSTFSNQPFYAPFTAMQQVIYLLAADGVGPFAFGKSWLTILVISFGLFFYAELRERIHPMLAGVLLTILACSPELFAYTFLVQTDWANAAFFATGVILLQHYCESGQRGPFIGSALLLAFACWTRTETIFFVPIGALLVLIQSPDIPGNKAILRAIALSIACLLPVIFWNYIFLRGYLPLPAHAKPGLLHGITDDYLAQLIRTYANMGKEVVFHDVYWGYAVWFFLLVSVVNVLVFRDRQGLFTLIWIVSIYMLFGLIIQHVDGANVPFTFRRGFFKLLFLMYFYLGTTSLFRWLSDRIKVYSTGFTG